MQQQSRREFVTRLGLGAAAVMMPGAALGQRKRMPNVIFFLADDLGWRDASAFGSTFNETPNLERLAKRGMMFTQAYAANPLCSPTRASIMTGLWPARIGITAPACHLPEERLQASVADTAGPNAKVISCESATRLSQSYFTLAEALRAAGYRTGHFGKWHLGPDPYDALHQGFDVDLPHTPAPGPAGGYFAPWKFGEQFQGPPGEHIEDRMSREAVKFIRENRERPFFLNYWHFSVHSPWVVGDRLQGKEDLIRKYRAKADPKNPQHNALYGAMVESLDAAVGTILDTIDELGLARDTIIVFMSDNGGVTFQEIDGAPVTSNAPLRNGKASIYEGGTREPCIIVWPGQVRPGSKSTEIIQSIDFYPTLLAMLGLKAQPAQAFDGISIVPALKGRKLHREAIFCYFPHAIPATGNLPSVYVRKGDWKLIRFFFDGPKLAHRYELYNLREDIGETNDLAAKMPAKVAELDTLIEQFIAEAKPVLPKPNPNYNPGVAGWNPSRDAKLSTAGGVLVIESKGGDPFAMQNDVPKLTGELIVEFRMRSTASGNAQVFWGAEGIDPLFFRDRSVMLPIAHDGEWHEYTVRLPMQGTLRALRIDPATAPGHIEIDWIRLKTADGTTQKEWGFD
jgi:arylsulfatase A-like enzyme